MTSETALQRCPPPQMKSEMLSCRCLKNGTNIALCLALFDHRWTFQRMLHLNFPANNFLSPQLTLFSFIFSLGNSADKHYHIFKCQYRLGLCTIKNIAETMKTFKINKAVCPQLIFKKPVNLFTIHTHTHTHTHTSSFQQSFIYQK